jgi:hypothetical protein
MKYNPGLDINKTRVKDKNFIYKVDSKKERSKNLKNLIKIR